MDLDRDGARDVITGSWPGELYWFRGTKGGTFELPTKLVGASGAPLRLGRATTVFAADWEADGDLDLLVGDIDGNVHLVPNASGDAKLSFGDAVAVRAADQPVKAQGGDAAPILADWDGDGRADLLVGGGSGQVLWMRDEAKAGAPSFAAPVELVPEASHAWTGDAGDPAAPPARSGARAKVAVADWDGDGRLDLLVGDVLSKMGPEPKLTPAQEQERDALRAQTAAAGDRMAARFDEARKRLAKELKIDLDAAERSGDEEALAKLEAKLMEALESDEAFRKAMEEDGALFEKLAALQAPHETHGHVWFFARLTKAAATTPATAPR